MIRIKITKVTVEAKVLIKTTLVAYFSLPLYFFAKLAQVLPTGIPINKTTIAVDWKSSLQNKQTTKAPKGITNKRIIEIDKIFLIKEKSKPPYCANILPISINEKGAKQPPIFEIAL